MKRGKIEKGNQNKVNKASMKAMMDKQTTLKFDKDLVKIKPFKVICDLCSKIDSIFSEIRQAWGSGEPSRQAEGPWSGKDTDKERTKSEDYAKTRWKSEMAGLTAFFDNKLVENKIQVSIELCRNLFEDLSVY